MQRPPLGGEVERLRALNAFAREVDATLDLDAVCVLGVARIGSLTGAVRCAVLQHVPGGLETPHLFRYRAVWQHGEVAGQSEAVFTAALAQEVFQTQAPLVVPDTRERSGPPMEWRVGDGILSVIAVPITTASMPWGVLNTSFTHALSSDDATAQAELLVSFASHLGVAVRNAETFSQLRAAHEELRVTQQRVIQQERLRALGEMASGVAHDLNNALSPVIGFSELLLAGGAERADPAQVKDYLELIHTGATDAAGVVARLREFYRQREGDEPREPLEVDRIVEQAVRLTSPKWRDQAHAAGKTITVRTELGTVPDVMGNEAELREALANLIFNAVDAVLPTAGRAGEIVLRTSTTGGSVILEVQDNGQGMPEEVRRHCLEPFFTTKGEAGTGLGLAMVWGIVRRHGGDVEIRSEPHGGTIVRIALPISETHDASATRPADVQPTAGLRVLVVDDDERAREVTMAYLVGEGLEVTAVDSGRRALDLLEPGRFDVLVTDLSMPEMTGGELALATRECAPQTRIVLATGFGVTNASGTPTLPGVDAVDAVVAKPMTRATLREALARATAGQYVPPPEQDAV